MMPVTSPAPGTITAVRILGWIQGALAAIATIGVLIITVQANSIANDIDAQTEFAFSGLATAAIGVLVFVCVILAALTLAILIPLSRLKPGHPGAGTGLVVVESVFVVLDIVALGQDGSAPAVIVIAMLVSIAMIVLLCSPPSRLWLRGAGAPSGPYPAFGAPATAGPPSPHPYRAPAAQGQWAPDPSGRHELRYYDGANWTPWVSNQGTVTSDPHFA